VKDGEAEEESGVDFSSLFTFMSGKHHENRSANNVIIGVSVMLLVVAGALIVGAVWSYCRMFAGRIGMRRSHEEREMYGKVQYSPLSENFAGRIGMRRSHEEREMYGKVQYSPLSENLEVS